MKRTTKLTIKFFWEHVKQYKLFASIMVLGLTVGIGIEILMPFFYKEFFDTLAAAQSIVTPDEVGSTAAKLIGIMVLVFGVNMIAWLFWRISEFTTDNFFSRVMYNIRNEVFQYLHQHSYTFFNNNFVGALVKKVSKLVGAFEGIGGKMYWDVYPLVLRIIVIMSILFIVNTTIGVIMLVWTIAYVIFNYAFAQYKLKYDIVRSEADTRITATIADTITNNINLKLFTSHGLETDRFDKVNEDWRKKAKKTWNLGSLLEAIQAILMISLELGIFYVAIKAWEQGSLTLGDFVLIQAFLFQIFHRLWDFGRVIRETYKNFADAEEMIKILNTPHDVKDSAHAKDMQIKKGKIEFKDVQFAYDKGTNVINGLNLNIKAAEKVAFIGPSGGGKSTIVKLLFRFFDVNSGKILIDGQNVAEVTQSSLRANLSLVPQDPILFHRTLMENIRYGKPDATDEEVIEAAKQANCHQFIKKFPNKYETYVGERGVKLSGGERQRVAIARAILKNAQILILDEATSSLDSESEALIQEALGNLMADKTSIVIAHRLSTIMQMDRIIVIKDGMVHETGTHSELTKQPDSLYKMLWELQAGGFIQ